jgi:hypothetical protein
MFQIPFHFASKSHKQFNIKQALIAYHLGMKTTTKDHKRNAQGCLETPHKDRNTQKVDVVTALVAYPPV